MPSRSTDPNGGGISNQAARPPSTVLAAQLRLHIDVVTVEVVRALVGHRVRPILLKGPAIATWIYDRGESRPYVDVDLLVAPEQLTVAEQVLHRVGFEPLADERVIVAFAEPHAVSWRRERDRAQVDLHWRIPGIAADPQRAWDGLSSQPEGVCIGHAHVEALGKPARALHVALHALQNGRESEQSMSDLRRAVERVDEGTWRSAVSLAVEVDATASLAAGLRLCSRGGFLADRLGLPTSVSTRLALWAQTPPPGAVRLHDLASKRGIWARARLLGSALAPPPDYVRALYPSARKGPRALALAYLRRPLAGIGNLPSAVRAVLRARAEARESKGQK